MPNDTAALATLALADQRQAEAAHLAGEVVAYWRVLTQAAMPEALVSALVLQFGESILGGGCDECQ